MKTRFMAAGMLLVLFAGPAYPQERLILQLQQDMIRLSTQMNHLQTSTDEKNAVLRGLVERIADQVNTITDNMQRITQSVDSVKAVSDKSSSEMRVILTSLDRNVNELQESLSSIRAQVNSVSQQVTTMKTTAPLEGPEDLMRTAVVDQFSGNYDLAATGFREFLSKYPTDPRAADAQLYVGEVLFAQKKFEQAVIEYDLVLQKYPDSDKKERPSTRKGSLLPN